MADAAARRLYEELGIRCELKERFRFTYRAPVGNGLTEHEFDHVFFGRCTGEVRPDPNEVMDVRWADPAAVTAELAAAPERFTAWFRICWTEVRQRLAQWSPHGA